MNGRRLTDAQISGALRAHLPDHADPELRERILDTANTTAQQRAVPSVIGAFLAADRVVPRRSLLLAAALLIALALASAAAVGSLRILQSDPVQNLNLEPRSSLQGVVAPISTPTSDPGPSAGPTPIPTPFPPEIGPVPAGARSWTVMVANKSSEPATLFLAEEGEIGPAQLCGSVTPNVVPPGVTEKVTFQLPPKRVKNCWIWVNPVPGQGGSMFQSSDAPLAGKFVIQEGENGAQGSWLSR